MVYIMEKGSIILHGSPEQIFEEVDLLRQAGLDVPRVTALAYELKQDGYPINKLPLTVKEAVDTMQNLIKEKLLTGQGAGLIRCLRVLYSEGLVEESEAKTDPSEAIITIKGLIISICRVPHSSIRL